MSRTYFRVKSTLYSYLNIKELHARSGRDIRSLSDCKRIRTHNHLVRKRTLVVDSNPVAVTWKTTVQYFCFLLLENFLKEHRIISTYELFTETNVISPNQSGFTPRDSCINQRLPITHEIYKSFDDDLEVRGMLLYISKTYDKV